MSDELKLLPCPFCGGTEAFVERLNYSAAYIQCDSSINEHDACLARGPVGVQEDDDEDIPGGAAAIKAWNEQAARRTAPVSAPMGENGEAIPLPPASPTYMTADQGFEWAWSTLKKDLNAERWTAGDEVQSWAFFKYGWDYRAQFERHVESRYAERIRHLERELEQARAAFIGSENARKDAERARETVQSIDTPEFREMLYSLDASQLGGGYTQHLEALIAYIDGRTAETAPGPWKVLSEGDKPDASRLLDVILTNGVCFIGRDYSKVDWTQVADWRYSAAAPTPLNGKEEAK